MKLAWATAETKPLVYVRLQYRAEIIVLGPTCVPGFEHMP